MTDLTKLVDELSKLTVLEAAELSKLLEAAWGVSAAAPVAVAAASPVCGMGQHARRILPGLGAAGGILSRGSDPAKARPAGAR